MNKHNVFVFGAQVSGESFFGRRAEIDFLAREMNPQSGNKGIAVIGMNRIGKSSLVHKVLEDKFMNRSDMLVVEMNLENASKPRPFWHALVTKLRDATIAKKLNDEEMDRYFDMILNSDTGSEIWFSSIFEVGFRNILRRIKNLGFRLILSIDEFDKASDLFSNELGSFGVIRDCAVLSDYSVTVVVLSRRRLGIIEKESLKGSGSTLEEAFVKYNLKGFSEEDMFEYWGNLTDYDVFSTVDMEETVKRYAGTNPYILNFYAHFMAEAAIAGEEVDVSTVERIHDELRGVHLLSYYEKLLARMKEDGYAEALRGVLCGPIVDISSSDVEKLISWGYLHVEKEGQKEVFCLVCPDYTQYFIENSRDITLPIWSSIMLVEMRFREHMKKVFPKLEDFRYSEVAKSSHWEGQIKHYYPNLKIRVNDSTKTFMGDAESYGKDASLIDVMTLTFIITTIQDHWNRFKQYFENDDLEKWNQKLELIRRARNPFAHSHPEYLTATETNLVQLYCNQILELKQ